MSLIKQTTKYPVYKPMKYQFAYEYWKTHEKLHWTEEEITLSDDIADFAKASPEEREFITNILRLFTQNDVMVGAGYDTMLRIFKPTEVQMMLRTFANRENTHISAYALLTESLGFGDEIYTEFLEIPLMETKTDYLEKAKVKKYEDYKAAGLTDQQVDEQFRRAVARMLAVYAGATEGISLMAQFAMLLKFQFNNKYKGMCQIVDWSIKDESQHQEGNSMLFREYIKENPDIWDDELKFEIYEAIREIVSYEVALVDYLNPPHMDKEDVKNYVKYMADNALKLLGMKPNYGIKENPLPYMEEITNGVSLVNFFEQRVTDYAKGALTGSWDELKNKK
jgi:ribonucleoside-diphosphate reductase beta chain